MDRLTKEQRHKLMQKIKSKDSKIEVKLAKSLFALGLRYRKNNKTIFGKPDISFKGLKIAIFVDGEFWHGKNWVIKKFEHKTNKEFWYKKIERNIERDKEVNAKLKEEGWKVLRFWGDDIENDLTNCIDKIQRLINEAKRKNNNKRN